MTRWKLPLTDQPTGPNRILAASAKIPRSWRATAIFNFPLPLSYARQTILLARNGDTLFPTRSHLQASLATFRFHFSFFLVYFTYIHIYIRTCTYVCIYIFLPSRLLYPCFNRWLSIEIRISRSFASWNFTQRRKINMTANVVSFSQSINVILFYQALFIIEKELGLIIVNKRICVLFIASRFFLFTQFFNTNTIAITFLFIWFFFFINLTTVWCIYFVLYANTTPFAYKFSVSRSFQLVFAEGFYVLKSLNIKRNYEDIIDVIIFIATE